MEKAYIILTNTGTALSKLVRFYTRDEYAHVSISMDKKLKHMYSFGRLNPYNPFIGGFVHEATNRGTFKRFYKTKAKILEIEVSDEQYHELKRAIVKVKKERRIYKFNVLGLFVIPLKIKYRKNHYFYCGEFIKYLIDQAHIENTLPELIRPEDFIEFEKENHENVVYEGLLRDYNKFLENNNI